MLEDAGYRVFSTSDADEAILHIRSGNCGTLLLCYSVLEPARTAILAQFRESCPTGRVVSITNHPVPRVDIEGDAFVYGMEGPEALLNAIRGSS